MAFSDKILSVFGLADVQLSEMMRGEMEEMRAIYTRPLPTISKEDLGLLVGRHIERTNNSMNSRDIENVFMLDALEVQTPPQNGIEVPNVDRLIQLILKYRLFQNGWVLRDDISDHHLKGEVIIGGAIKWVDGVAVGAAVIIDTLRRAGCYRDSHPDKQQLHVFVRKAHRRKGIGGELISAIRDQFTPGTYAEIGVDGSEYFWGKMKVTIK